MLRIIGAPDSLKKAALYIELQTLLVRLFINSGRLAEGVKLALQTVDAVGFDEARRNQVSAESLPRTPEAVLAAKHGNTQCSWFASDDEEALAVLVCKLCSYAGCVSLAPPVLVRRAREANMLTFGALPQAGLVRRPPGSRTKVRLSLALVLLRFLPALTADLPVLIVLQPHRAGRRPHDAPAQPAAGSTGRLHGVPLLGVGRLRASSRMPLLWTLES